MKKKLLGPAFNEKFIKVTKKTGHYQSQKEKSWEDLLIPNFQNIPPIVNDNRWRVISVIIIVLILFFVIFLRLFHLQVVKGQEMRELADGNRVKVRIIHAPRGVIYDRNSKVLAANSPGFRLIDSKTKKATFISRDESLALEVNNSPEVNSLEVDTLRNYPKGDELSHILGYVGEISEEEMKQPEYSDYRPGDKIGKAGIEYQYEKILRGKDGGEIIEVDSKGRKIRTIRSVDPIPGQNLYLTIDADLQHVAFVNLKSAINKAKSCCGTAILENPTNGEILSLVSYPTFNNNLFIGNQNENEVSEILSDPSAPILNRAIGGTYPPGSTYKIVSSLAGLGSGKISDKTIYIDNGIMSLGPYTFANWYFSEYGKTEGAVDIYKALKRSNDIYFYNVGQLIGEKVLADYSKKVKIGQKLGIDIPGEEEGLVPTNEWKLENYQQVWYPGDTLHMAIGQGFLLTTPLQVLAFTSLIADNGNLYQPRLAKTITDVEGKTIREFTPKLLTSKIVSSDIIKIIQKGLEAVPMDGGTGWPFFTFPIKTAGKTGTAEIGDAKGSTHAWYTAYAPADDPKITATVLVEAGGEGSSVAAPVVKEVFRYFLSPDKSKLLKDIAPLATESAKTLGE